MNPIGIAVLGICLFGACGGESDDAAQTNHGFEELKKVDQFIGRGDTGGAGPWGDLKLIPVPSLASLQPSIRAMNVRFLGWTNDESRYVVEVTHATNWPNMDAGPLTYEVYQVHDTLSGKMTNSFRKTLNGVLPSKRDKDVRYWQQAKPKKAWRKWLKKNQLVKSPATTEVPGWALEAALVPDTLASVDRIKIVEKPGEFQYRWTIVKSSSDKTKAPKVELRWKGKPKSSSVIQYSIPFRIRDFYHEMDGPVQARGSFRVHFSPSGHRVLLVTNSALMVDNEGFPFPVGMSYVRSLGPQLKIKDSTGTKQARWLAGELEGKSLPVTVVESPKGAEPVERSMLYYRNLSEGDRATIRSLVPGMGEELLVEKGWIDGIILLAP